MLHVLPYLLPALWLPIPVEPPTHLNGPPAAFCLTCVQMQWCQEVRQLQPQHPLNNVHVTIYHLSDAMLNLQKPSHDHDMTQLSVYSLNQ